MTKPRYDYWIKAESWTILEGAFLVCDIEPPSRDSAALLRALQTLGDDTLRDIYIEAKRRTTKAGQRTKENKGLMTWYKGATPHIGGIQVEPAEFVAWAHGRNYTIPASFLTLLATETKEATGWKAKAQQLANTLFLQSKDDGQRLTKGKIAKKIESRFQLDGTRGSRGQQLPASYIVRHALNGWTPPK